MGGGAPGFLAMLSLDCVRGVSVEHSVPSHTGRINMKNLFLQIWDFLSGNEPQRSLDEMCGEYVKTAKAGWLDTWAESFYDNDLSLYENPIPLDSGDSTTFDMTHSLDLYGNDGPICNIDGTPMVGEMDINGNPYGVTNSFCEDLTHSSDFASSSNDFGLSSSDTFSSHDISSDWSSSSWDSDHGGSSSIGSDW